MDVNLELCEVRFAQCAISDGTSSFTEKPLKLDRYDTLFADEETFKVIPEEDKSDDDVDEDNPFFLSIRSIGKLKKIVGMSKIKPGSILDTRFQPRIKPLYQFRRQKKQPSVTDHKEVSSDPATKTSKRKSEKMGGHIMSTSQVVPTHEFDITFSAKPGKVEESLLKN